jgi:hypothetical protein
MRVLKDRQLKKDITLIKSMIGWKREELYASSRAVAKDKDEPFRTAITPIFADFAH